MIRQLIGIATLTLRSIIRTRAFVVFALVLGAYVVCMPWLVAGDGTAAGARIVMVRYTLGGAFTILCIATLWLSCACFAGERESRRLQMTAVKPVRSAMLWLGQWCALIILNMVLLMIVYGAVYTTLRFRMGELPTCSRVIHPVLPSPLEEARYVYNEMKAEGRQPTNMTERAALAILARRARDRYDIIDAGGTQTWNFQLDRAATPRDAARVRIRFESAYNMRTTLSGKLFLSDVAGRPLATHTISNAATQTHYVFPMGEAFPGTEAFSVAFMLTGDARTTSAALVRSRQDIVVLIDAGSMGMNFVRAACVHGLILAILAAFGLTLGACLSLPVALFAAIALACATSIGESIDAVAIEDVNAPWTDRVGLVVSRALIQYSRVSTVSDPVDRICNDEYVAWRDIARATIPAMIQIAFLLALAAVILARRDNIESM